MRTAAKTVGRGAAESYLRQGIEALGLALDRACELDQVVPDTRYIERQLQEALDMIRGVATECHRAQFSYVDHAPMMEPGDHH